MRIEANTFGSDYDSTLAVYTGVRGALEVVAQNDDANGTSQSRVRFDAVAGTTCYFMIGSRWEGVPSASLTFNVIQGPPPFSINPVVTQFGSVKPSTGVARISGWVSCTEPAYVTIGGQPANARQSSDQRRLRDVRLL